MFGTIHPYGKTLDQADRDTYKKYYCGLCFALGKVSGIIAKFTLSNDLTFAYIVLDSLTQGKNELKCRCIAACGRKRKCIYHAKLADYVASMNLILAYKKLEDDVIDDHSWSANILCKLFFKSYETLKNQYSKTVCSIEKELERGYQLEREHADYKELAECFSRITREFFTNSPISELEKTALAGLGEWIGKWIYVADAWADYEQDIKEDKFNPLRIDGQDTLSKEQIHELTMYLSNCKYHIQEYIVILGIRKNIKIIDNILNENMNANIGKLLRKEEKHDKK